MTELTMVHFGDSITFGQYVDPASRWTTLLEDRLRPAVEATDVELVIQNRGVSGETTRQALERYPEDVQSVAPDILTLQFGLNDCNRWATDGGLPRVSEQAYVANLHEMIERARRFGVRRIIVANNHPTLRDDDYERGNARYGELACEVAADQGTVFCDIRGAFIEFSVAELAELLLPLPDVLHLSEEGNRVYADAMEPFVRAAIEEAAGVRLTAGRR